MRRVKQALSAVLSMILVVGLYPGVIAAHAEGVSYTRGATAVGSSGGYDYPGVYTITANTADKVGSDKKPVATLGIPSVAKQNLENGPTKESPAIIMGGAVPYEIKTGPTEFTQIPGGRLYAPYSSFRYKIIEEADQGGTGGTHRKMSGFDGTYYIVRVDVSDIIAGAPEGSYLHVKQEGNKVLMVQMGYEESENKDQTKAVTFATGGNKSACYSLANNAEALKDTAGGLTDKPYVDVIIFSSGTGVAGADTGSTDPTVANADFTIKFYVDQVADYNPDLVYDPASTDTNHPTNVMAKYYDESKLSSDTDIYGYTVMGSDLEIEIMHDDDHQAIKESTEFWSLRKAMNYVPFDGTPIKMICEVPVLEGLSVDGTAQGGRNIIFDVNSFDIQIANHQSTGVAGLSVKNATLTLMDGFNTTGAELAVGNNATMRILEGGKLIIADTCQLEVEYDAASTAPPEGGGEVQPTTYDCGIIAIENGGEIENNGVITIEGTEGKPLDPANPSVRDIKNAVLNIQEGGTLTNNGCLLSYGALFNMGTIVNNGRYNDLIQSNDPDKGTFTYHKGIQISWKDDVTQDSVVTGSLMNGCNSADESASFNTNATIANSGDIVLVPGILNNYGVVENKVGGNIYLCAVEEAIIPVLPTADQPTIVEKRIRFGNPMQSFILNEIGGNFANRGTVSASDVEIVSNGRTGTLTPATPDNVDDCLYFDNFGTMVNSGSMMLDRVVTYSDFTNTGNGTIEKCAIVTANGNSTGRLVDKTKKLTEVYGATKTETSTANVWKYGITPKLSVTPTSQSYKGGEKASWTALVTIDDPSVDESYLLDIVQLNPAGGAKDVKVSVKANEETVITGPVLPEMNGNVLYGIYVEGYTDVQVFVSVSVTSESVTPPAAKEDLVYDGKDQELITAGYSYSGTKLQYKVGADGEWSTKVPKAKDAGDYEVFYKLKGSDTELGSLSVSIAKRAATISADNLTGLVNTDLKELTYTVNGVVDGDTLATVVINTDADKTTVGTYDITITLSDENPNYDITVKNGTYSITDKDFVVTAKDKHGVYSDDVSYKGFNIELTAPKNATVYYSTKEELTSANYKTAGQTAELFAIPAAAGTHTVYYYVTDETETTPETVHVSGSKQVIIDKASQKAPENLTTGAESFKNAGDGFISGTEARTMEYRGSGSTTYKTIYYTYFSAESGDYYVRRIGDSNHYPSPDTKVTVAEGPAIKITFDSNGGSEVAAVEGLAYGDLVPPPADPEYEGYDFKGWYLEDELYDFSAPVTMEFTLKAKWEEKIPADITSLKEIIAEAEEFNNSIKDDESYAAISETLQSAIDSAKETAALDYPTEEEIADAVSALKTALQNAKDEKAKVDGIAGLNDAIAEAEEFLDTISDNELYTDIATDLSDAIEAAKAVAQKENPTDEEIINAVKAVNEALQAAKEAKEAADEGKEEEETEKKADEEAAKDVIDKIDAIGTVEYTEECKARIEAARAAYEALTDTQKALVDNLSALEAAEAEFEEMANRKEIDWLAPLRTQLNVGAEMAKATGQPCTVYYASNYALPYEFMKFLQENPLVTLEYTIEYKDVSYTLVIPGGKVTADAQIPWYGLEYLIGNFGPKEVLEPKAEDGTVKAE